MASFRVESVRIKTTPEKAFRYIPDPKNLPEWTHAFEEVQNGKATMATPAGVVEVGLRVDDPNTPRVCLLAGSLSVDVLAERELKQSVLTYLPQFRIN